VGQLTIQLLRKVDPEARLIIAAYLFWISIFAGIASCMWLASTWYEKVLMGISWGAITVTCMDIIVSADIRAEVEDSNGP